MGGGEAVRGSKGRAGKLSLCSAYPARNAYALRSRGAMRPRFCMTFALSPKRGRGEDRVRAAPAVSQACCKEICCPRAYRFSGEHPAFPAQWLYGLYDFVLVTGFLATIVSFGFRLRRLDASTGASDPNDFTVRNDHARQSQPSRPPLPAPRSRRWPTPLLVGQDGGVRKVFLPDSGSGIFFTQGLDRLSY